MLTRDSGAPYEGQEKPKLTEIPMDHKARFDTLKATRDSLWALLEDTQDSLSLIEGQMDEAAQAWAQETGREAQELL